MVVCFGLLFAAVLNAAEPIASAPPSSIAISTGNMSLNSILELVRKNNPEIQAARHAWAAAENVPEQARALNDPTLGISRMLTKAGVQTTEGPMMDQFSISQKIPFWGKRALRGQAASLAAGVAYQAFRAKSLEIMDRAVRAYYGLYFLDKTTDILAEQQSVLNRFSRSAIRKYAVGKAPETEALRAQVELAKIENDLVTAEEEQQSARARLNALLDRSALAPLGRPQRPDSPIFRWDETAWSRQALTQRPEILALEALKNKSAVERRLAIRNYFPDLTLGYQYSEIGGGTTNIPYDGRDVQALTFGLDLPIWLGKENAALRQSRENLAASRSGLAAMIDQTGYEVDDLCVKADTAARLFKLYQDAVLPQAQAALDSSQSSYEVGKTSFLSLLDSERSLLSFELDQERHRVDFEIDIADLERVSGGPLSAAGGKK